MSEEPENKPVRIPKWLWVGSAFWLISVFSFAWLVFWPNVSGGLKPNEFGDLLAGAFSPLAFAWFVYAVLMQRQELELQRIELKETRKVLRDQEEAQKSLSEQTKYANKLTARNLIDSQIENLLQQFCAVAQRTKVLELHFENGRQFHVWYFFDTAFSNQHSYIYSSMQNQIMEMPSIDGFVPRDNSIEHNKRMILILENAISIQKSIVKLCNEARQMNLSREDSDLHDSVLEKLKTVNSLMRKKIAPQ